MNKKANQGFVLVFSILLLLVMTIIGISIMSGSQMQERMSGNARIQSLAFQGATAGVADAVNFVDFVRTVDPNLECGGTSLSEWQAMWLDTSVNPPRPRPTDWFPRGGAGDPNVEIRSRLYCLWDDETDQGRSQLYVESAGLVRSGEQIVANRSVEVRIVSGRDGATGDPTCAIGALCDPSQENPLSAFNPPASGASFVGGDTGHALCACSDGMRRTITDQIRRNRQRSFSGVGGNGADAIQGPDDEGNFATRSPFDSVESFLEFIDALRQIALEDGTFSAGGHSGGFDWPDQVRFVDGDLASAGGNFGSGILVVTGDIELRGNFTFEGMIIGMGEVLGLRGAGGEEHGVNGSVVAAPIDFSTDPPRVGQINLSFHEPGNNPGAGGGGVSYAFDCDKLKAAEQLLTGRLVNGNPLLDGDDEPVFDEEGNQLFEQVPATDFWRANCDGGLENIFLSGPAELQLVSWRENLGWREQEGFFSTRLVIDNN